jgi:hypothetical protein
MTTDITWDHFDRLVESYAAASAYVTSLAELEARIGQACAALLASRAGISDLTSLLSTRAGSSEEVPRKIAWASQHIFGRRAWCVGQKVVLRRDGGMRASSPLVIQLNLLGHVPIAEQFASVDAAWNGVGYATHEKIDALLAAPSENEITLVKGCSYSQAKRVSPALWVNADRESLFAQGARFMSHLYVRREGVAALLLARDVLRAAYPHLRVRAVYLVINDPDCSWHFQAHDLSTATWDALKKSRVNLDPFAPAATFRQFREAFASDGDTFAGLPAWCQNTENFLAATPVDRPTRAMMLLNDLWMRQLNKPDRLIVVKGADLADAVSDRHSISYPADLWRHDLEDCLERGRFIRRSTDRDSSFALLPKGVARLLLLKQKFNPNVPQVPAMVIHHVARQAKLWSTAPVG